jgi:two-component system sensor histidine kinase MprB
VPVRVVLRPAGDGDVVAISRSLVPVEETLAGLRTLLFAVCLAGVVVAGATGLLLAPRALAPLGRLTAAAEHIARTEDPDTRCPWRAATRSACSGGRSPR